jgi:hypothetical protein
MTALSGAEEIVGSEVAARCNCKIVVPRPDEAAELRAASAEISTMRPATRNVAVAERRKVERCVFDIFNLYYIKKLVESQGVICIIPWRSFDV